MTKRDKTRLSKIIASLIGSTEENDVYTISQHLIGFKTSNAAKLIESYITLQPEEFPDWQSSLEGVDPIYHSSTEGTAHTVSDYFDIESIREALDEESQDLQMEKNWFMPLFETIARFQNTGSKCYRISENLESYFEDYVGKEVTLGMIKLSINLLMKASQQFFDSVDAVRLQCKHLDAMQTYFDTKMIDMLKSTKYHLVPNLEDFFRMRKHLQAKYFNPVNYYFEKYAHLLNEVPKPKVYQDSKHRNETGIAFNVIQDIKRLMNDSNDVFTGAVEVTF